MQTKFALATALIISLSGIVGVGNAADLPPIVVTNGADDGAGPLRAAIRDAMPGSTITFDFAGDVFLTTGLFDRQRPNDRAA